MVYDQSMYRESYRNELTYMNHAATYKMQVNLELATLSFSLAIKLKAIVLMIHSMLKLDLYKLKIIGV